MNTFTPISKKRPDANQLAVLIVAKASGTPIPAGAREFEHHVKKVSGQTPTRRVLSQTDCQGITPDPDC